MRLAAIATFIFVSVSLIPALAADEKPTAAGKETVKFIELKYLGTDSSDRLNRVISVVQQLTGGTQIVHDPVLRTLAIKGTPEAIANAEQLLRRFDTPAAESKVRQTQLSVYLVEAFDQVSSDHRIPSELSSAVEQLRTAFGYKSFRLVDTMLFQGRENAEFSISGLVPMPENAAGAKTVYMARYKNISYNDAQKTVFVNGFRFELRVPVVTSPAGATPVQHYFADSGIVTDLAIKDGQKLVLGKLTKDQSERGVFLIVTAKVD